ncbi:MAG: cohesin domain-containing protein [Pseudomonadota bacterium]
MNFGMVYLALLLLQEATGHSVSVVCHFSKVQSIRIDSERKVVRLINHLAVWLLGALFAAPVQATVVFLGSSNLTVRQGESFEVSAVVHDVNDLYQFGIHLLRFNPDIFSVHWVTPGSFLAAGGSTHFDGGYLENEIGSLALVSDSLVGDVPGVSGSGTLLTVLFDAKAPGNSSINLLFPSLFDSNFNEIPLAYQSASVQIQVVPEPGTLALLLAGLVLGGASRKGFFRKRMQMSLLLTT